MAAAVTVPARISVKNFDPGRSSGCPLPSSRNHRPTKLEATRSLTLEVENQLNTILRTECVGGYVVVARCSAEQGYTNQTRRWCCDLCTGPELKTQTKLIRDTSVAATHTPTGRNFFSLILRTYASARDKGRHASICAYWRIRARAVVDLASHVGMF